ncbi:MAG: DUF4169 domain-containing protein [Roseobacter sp. MedPE-SW]|nr:MAG: DUF4169 domain-containing protein [Roseobacter sp. MedPE-SW]
MGKPVNLNRFRKTQARAKDKARADENAVKFGRSKLEKELEMTRTAKAKRDLDGHLGGDKGDP